MSLSRDLDLLYELGTLRLMNRTWKRFLNADFANNAEHLFRVAWIALVIAKHEKAENTEKILKIALAHDIAETRTGDVDYLSRQYVVRNEELGLADMLSGTVLEQEFKALLHEYEVRESIESKIVKDADNLDVDLELREQAARGFGLASRAEWKKMRKQVHDTRMFTKTGKRLAAAIDKSDPHGWHINSERNRLHGGDWKNTK
jgi:5'-deoxynucleotidase YfbR-like HD superfamily hydrolase